MKPYYSHAGIEIFLGDCRDVLPNLTKVDCVITDPPYGLSGGSGTIGKQRAHKHSYTLFEDTEDFVYGVVIPAFTQAMNLAGGRAIVTPGPKCFTAYPAPSSFGAFYNHATCSLSKWGKASSQPIFYYGAPPELGKKIYETTFLMKGDAGAKYDHPCVKPLASFKKLVEMGSNAGEVILDPFMGAGTTLVAAKELGRKAIGIEIEERYCEIAAKRLSQEMLPIFEAEKQKPEQVSFIA